MNQIKAIDLQFRTYGCLAKEILLWSSLRKEASAQPYSPFQGISVRGNISSRERLKEQLSWREKLDLHLHLFKCQKSHLEIPNQRENQLFCSGICDIAHYCVAQPVGLFRNKETLGGWDAQRSSYPSANMWEPWSEQGCWCFFPTMTTVLLGVNIHK